MASGSIHGSVTIGAAFGVLAGFFVGLFLPVNLLPLVFIGVLIGLFVGPDLDVDANWRGDYLMRRLHLEGLYDLFWFPYRISIKHRSPLSHTPILGTVLRAFYSLFPLMVVFIHDQPQNAAFRIKTGLKSQMVACVGWVFWWYWWFWLPTVIPPLFLGLILADTLHWLYDQNWIKVFY